MPEYFDLFLCINLWWKLKCVRVCISPFFFSKLGPEAVVDSLDEDDRASLPSLRMEGCGPLHSVAGSGNMAVCKYLVEQLGFDVDFEAINHGSGTCALSNSILSYFMFTHELCLWDSMQNSMVLPPFHISCR
jgi:hypothetical protein